MNSHIWENQYKREISEIFAIQEEITDSIANGLQLKLTGGELEGLTKRHTEDSEAHDSLAYILHSYWDFTGAEREFKRAIELNPGYATAHQGYSIHLIRMARFSEAIAEAKRALELEPFSLAINRWFGRMFFWARQYGQAVEALNKTIKMDPAFLLTHESLCLVYLQKLVYEEALAKFQKEKELRKGRHPEIERYEKFLELWKDADAGFTEVEDAKKRLTAIKAQ